MLSTAYHTHTEENEVFLYLLHWAYSHLDLSGGDVNVMVFDFLVHFTPSNLGSLHHFMN